MDVLITALTVGGPLVGVWVGSLLTRRTSKTDWLRERRADAYLELLDLLVEINQTFGVGLRTSRLDPKSAKKSGHDFAGIENVWRDHLDQLAHVELRIYMLGGKLGESYRTKIDAYVLDMLGIVNVASPSEQEWDKIVADGYFLREHLLEIGREDLGALTLRERMRLRRKN